MASRQHLIAEIAAAEAACAACQNCCAQNDPQERSDAMVQMDYSGETYDAFYERAFGAHTCSQQIYINGMCLEGRIRIEMLKAQLKASSRT
jgi:hypothetical protein